MDKSIGGKSPRAEFVKAGWWNFKNWPAAATDDTAAITAVVKKFIRSLQNIEQRMAFQYRAKPYISRTVDGERVQVTQENGPQQLVSQVQRLLQLPAMNDSRQHELFIQFCIY
jgi:hypothetical protein